MRKIVHFGNNKRRSVLLSVLAAVLVLAAAGATLAYIVDSTSPVRNIFAPGKVDIEIDETVNNGVKSSVTVKNAGNTAVYIRAAVIGNTVSDDGDITGAADVSSCLCGSGWTKAGDYYYYTLPVAPGGSTANLLSNSVELTGKQVTVLADGIQSEPAAAVTDAWGSAAAQALGLQ